MIKDDEIMLIDIGDAATGHPAFDLGGLMLAYIILPQSTSDKKRDLLGFDLSLGQNMWGVMCGTYFQTGDQAEIGRITQMLMPVTLMLMSYHALSHTALDDEGKKVRTDALIRGKFLPAIENAPEISF